MSRLRHRGNDWLWITEAILLVALAVATAWPAVALRLTRYRLVRFLVGATRVSPIGGLSTALADLLHDPSDSAALSAPARPACRCRRRRQSNA